MKFYFRSLSFFMLLLTIQRIFFVIIFFNEWKVNSFSELARVLITGVRFDFMTVGYCLIPILVFFIPFFPRFFLNKIFSVLIFKSTIFLLAVLLCIIGFFDIEWFHVFGDRFNSVNSWELFTQKLSIDGILFVSLLFFSLLLLTSAIFIWRRSFPMVQALSIWSWLLLVFFTAVMIRGSFDEHHLDLRHSHVTSSSFLNKASLSSAYALDQALRHRR